MALASLRELLEIVRRRGSFVWSTQEDKTAALLLARAVALALREEAPSNVSAQANCGLELKGADEVAGGGEVDEKASEHEERRKSGREAQSSNRESDTFGGNQSSNAVKSNRTNSDSSSQVAHGSGLRAPSDIEMLDADNVLKDVKVQLAAEVLRGGILTQTLAVKDPSHLEALGMAAKASLREVLRDGAAGAGDFWTPISKGLSVPLEISTLTSAEGHPEADLFLRRASIYLDLLHFLLTEQSQANPSPEDSEAGKDLRFIKRSAILACTAFCCMEGSGMPVWTDTELSRKAQDVVQIADTADKGLPQQTERSRGNVIQLHPTYAVSTRAETNQSDIQRIVIAHLTELLSSLHPILKTKSDGSDEAAFRVSQESPLGASVVAAHQLSFIVRSINFPNLGPVISNANPCALTAVDHWSPLVKKQGLQAIAHIVENVTVAELGWFAEVTMDALCKSAVGCDEEVWPVVLPTLVKATVRIEGADPRGKWYSHVFLLLLRDMELHYSDTSRRIIWLREIPPLISALKLFVVGHFKRLMPLLLTWLRAPDAETQVRTLDLLKLVIVNTWPRMPAHAERLTSELRKASEESGPGPERATGRSKIEEACELLRRCSKRPLGGLVQSY